LTDITVAQAAIIEDHVWALMEALGVRDSLRINQRITEAIVTVLDRQRDALPVAQDEEDYLIKSGGTVSDALATLPESDTRVRDYSIKCDGPCLTRMFREVNGPNYRKCVTCGHRFRQEQVTA